MSGLDFKVAGKCSSSQGNVADTDLATCLPAVGDNECPHNFLKLEDDGSCESNNVCCLMRPTFELNVRIVT